MKFFTLVFAVLTNKQNETGWLAESAEALLKWQLEQRFGWPDGSGSGLGPRLGSRDPGPRVEESSLELESYST